MCKKEECKEGVKDGCCISIRRGNCAIVHVGKDLKFDKEEYIRCVGCENVFCFDGVFDCWKCGVFKCLDCMNDGNWNQCGGDDEYDCGKWYCEDCESCCKESE